MLNSQIENIINMYYQGENEELYVAKSAERLDLPVEIVAFCAIHNVELKIMTNYENPSEKWFFTMGEYKEGNFEVEYTTILSVSKLANVYALEHSFEVLNKDPNKIEPVLVGDSEAAYNVGQFDLEELVKQFVHKGVSYVTFYEDYYNDIIDAKVRLESVQIEIYRCECSKDELIIFLCSDIYSNENYILLKALSEQLNEFDIGVLISYFSSEFLSQNIDFAEELLYLLSKYKNENVYQYF
ncbi:hypothetical protein HB904_12870, partial [Listeria booriae]